MSQIIKRKISSKRKILKTLGHINYLRLGVLFVIFMVFCSLVYKATAATVTLVLESDLNPVALFTKPEFPEEPKLDIKAYDDKMLYLAHRLSTSTSTLTSTLTSTAVGNSVAGIINIATSTVISSTTKKVISTTATSTTKYLWPAPNTAYPKAGAIFPFKRIVAFYGNLYSKKMGVLGEYSSSTMLAMLKQKVHEWELADPATPVIPALHYIAVVAQGSAGADGMYRARMPDAEIQKVIEMAKSIDAIIFLDVQVAKSNLQKELPPLEKYLKLPNVHLGIDPEFSMKTDKKPGSVIGTMDATDINFAAQFLQRIVQENNLPPKVLTFYRFTRNMVTNYKLIKTLPEVQLVLTMDGWGHQARKIQTYKSFVYPEPIQFTGFKLFFKNDLKEEGSRMMTPAEVLKLTPSPVYIQYQ